MWNVYWLLPLFLCCSHGGIHRNEEKEPLEWLSHWHKTIQESLSIHISYRIKNQDIKRDEFVPYHKMQKVPQYPQPAQPYLSWWLRTQAWKFPLWGLLLSPTNIWEHFTPPRDLKGTGCKVIPQTLMLRGVFAGAGILSCPHIWKRISKHLTEPVESGAPPAPGPGCLPRLLGSLPDSSQDLLYKQEQWQFGKASRGCHGGDWLGSST